MIWKAELPTTPVPVANLHPGSALTLGLKLPARKYRFLLLNGNGLQYKRCCGLAVLAGAFLLACNELGYANMIHITAQFLPLVAPEDAAGLIVVVFVVLD
jgi:hypothetical protein